MSREGLKIEDGGFAVYSPKHLGKINAMRRAASTPDSDGPIIPTKGQALFTTAEEMNGEPASCMNCVFLRNDKHCALIGPRIPVEKFVKEEVEYFPCCSMQTCGISKNPDYITSSDPDYIGLVWINAPKVGQEHGGANCFVGGTEIFTGGDFVPIEDIRKGMDIQGGVVLDTIRRMTQTLQEVKIVGWPDAITCTPEHRWLTRRGWVEAKNLHIGDALVTPQIESQRSEYSTEFWWAVGLWIAEGSTAIYTPKGKKEYVRHSVIWTVGHKERHLLKKVKKIMKRHKFASRQKINRVRTGWRWEIVDKRLALFLQRFGTYCHNKRLTNDAMRLRFKPAMSLLNGYLTGDGHLRKDGQFRATSSSKQLLLDFKMLLGKFELPSTVVVHRRGGSQWHIEGRTGIEKPSWELSISIATQRLKINTIKGVRVITGPEKEVFDLTVTPSHFFVVGGVVVHNCGGCNGGDDCDHFITDGKTEKWDSPTGFCRALQTTVACADVCSLWIDDDQLDWQTAVKIIKEKDAR